MKNKAFTLIEMMVAISVFALVISASSSLFVSALRAQRQNLATQELLDQISYASEYMSKAIRMAQKDMDGSCTGTAKINYSFLGNCLKFVNSYDDCQEFCLEEGRIKEIKNHSQENYLTSESLAVSSFNVDLSGQYQPPIDYLQPKVTIYLSVQGNEQSGIDIQITVSQRNLDIKN
jgi:prepilin-type N-terminal cleavage/methylation domain-containing protein